MPTYGPSPRPSHYNAQEHSPPRRYNQEPLPRRAAEEEEHMMHHQPPPAPRYNRNLDQGGVSLRRGEQVEVRIRGNVWIVGLLVSGVHLLSSYLNQGFDVEYRDGRTNQVCIGTFPVEDIRPYATA